MAFAPVFGRVFPATFDRRAAVAVTPGLTNFFLQSYTGSRNDFAGTVGYAFTIGASNITIVALGRSVSTSIASDHRTGIWTSAGVLLADVIIGASSPVDGLGYAYEMLLSPIELSASTLYVVGSQENAFADAWRDLGDISNHVATATVSGGRYAFPGFAYPANSVSADETGYVPVTFFT